ncbi:hypothetical protein AU467_00010 [Mesorhizobium loti]|uniref:HTH araC/xylS-type domain-containing protein n=1 Tax=Rhizobium loti TaxID=381 RepID=A0A101KXE5_RHILI|nr:hypothetical protein AU467_00010 [Mesorhizobium loti]
MSTQVEELNEGTFLASPHLFVSLIRSGSTKVICNIKAQEYSVNLHPGQLNILAPGEPVHLKWDRCVHTTHLYLRAPLLAEIAADFCGDDPLPLEIFSRLGLVDPLLEGLINAIGEALELDPERSHLYVENLARAAACRVLSKHSNLRLSQNAQESSSELSKSQIACFREVVETRMNQKLSLADLAEGSGLSTGHFSHLFKRTTGSTPYQHLLQSRVQRARYLLAKTRMSVSQIAAECGFSDQIHFTRAFSKIVGQPPAAYRKLAAD